MGDLAEAGIRCSPGMMTVIITAVVNATNATVDVICEGGNAQKVFEDCYIRVILDAHNLPAAVDILHKSSEEP